MKAITDVVIVGAGVVGCSVAYHLARLGTRVMVVEKGSIAYGMTKRSGGLVTTHYSLQAEARLALQSMHYFQDWSNVVGGTSGFVQTGFVRIVDQAQARQLESHIAELMAIGVNAQMVSPNDLSGLEPSLVTEDIAAAVFEPEAGFVDSMAATQALAARAKALGCKFQTGTLVRSILVDHGRVFAVETNAGRIDALTVVIAAGPWSDRLLKPLGIEIGLESKRARVAFFDRPVELKAGHPAFSDAITGAHFRPHTFGLLLGGLNDSEKQTVANPDYLDESIDPQFLVDVQHRIARRLPPMARARFVRGHAGIYDMTPDGHAVLDRAPGIHGLIIAAGFSGTGFALAPAVGSCIAEWVTDGEVRSVDLSPFRLARFHSAGDD